MASLAEQLGNLAKANFCLCVRLAEIAGEEGEEYLRIGNKAMTAAADQGLIAATRITPGGASATIPSPAGAFNLLSEVQKGQQRIGGDLKAAVEEWQRTWLGALAPSSAATDMLGTFLKPWFGNRPDTGGNVKPATTRVAA